MCLRVVAGKELTLEPTLCLFEWVAPIQSAVAPSIAPVVASLSELWVTVTVTVHETVAAVAYDEPALDIVQSVSEIHLSAVLGAGSSYRYEAVPYVAQNKLGLGRA